MISYGFLLKLISPFLLQYKSQIILYLNMFKDLLTGFMQILEANILLFGFILNLIFILNKIYLYNPYIKHFTYVVNGLFLNIINNKYDVQNISKYLIKIMIDDEVLSVKQMFILETILYYFVLYFLDFLEGHKNIFCKIINLCNKLILFVTNYISIIFLIIVCNCYLKQDDIIKLINHYQNDYLKYQYIKYVFSVVGMVYEELHNLFI